eukprot:7669443-Alexandrium_andersonii.AAC.1
MSCQHGTVCCCECSASRQGRENSDTAAALGDAACRTAACMTEKPKMQTRPAGAAGQQLLSAVPTTAGDWTSPARGS